MDLKISTVSKVYIKIPLSAMVNGAVRDPSGDSVSFAFTKDEDLSSTTWYSGSWETDAKGVHRARCLVGPGGVVQLAKGTYIVSVKPTDSPEIPALFSGVLKVV